MVSVRNRMAQVQEVDHKKIHTKNIYKVHTHIKCQADIY